jgi:hypothetical protein
MAFFLRSSVKNPLGIDTCEMQFAQLPLCLIYHCNGGMDQRIEFATVGNYKNYGSTQN